jgi:predicted CXXCH cytochrome family protein
MSRIAIDGTRGRSRHAHAGLLGALVLLASTVFVQSEAVAQIANTKHNLGSTNAIAGANKFSGSTEICVFCHTPHGGDTAAAVPLWNRTLANPNTYTTYDSLGTSTLDGKTLPVGSVSIACLSCHDGVQAMNSVINAPGSGFGGDAAWIAGTWTGTRQTAGAINNTSVALLGTDLRNDHPIGIQYCGGGWTVASGTGSCADGDFNAPSFATIGPGKVFWVNTAGGTGGRDKTDMILYNRTGTFNGTGGSAAAAGEPFVECASCHDPHTNSQATFLRTANTGSAVCLACHVK